MVNWSDTVVQFSDDMRLARLVRPMTFAVRGMLFHVASGFETDFASIPRLLWRVLPPWGRYGRGAILHDYLYRTAKVTRLEADRCFLEQMAADGVGRARRWVIYAGLRVGGWKAWNAIRKRQALESERRLKRMKEKLADAKRSGVGAGGADGAGAG